MMMIEAIRPTALCFHSSPTSRALKSNIGAGASAINKPTNESGTRRQALYRFLGGNGGGNGGGMVGRTGGGFMLIAYVGTADKDDNHDVQDKKYPRQK